MEEKNSHFDVSFEAVVAALLDPDTTFNPRYLYSLSDLVGNELSLFKKTWPNIPDWRREALLEDMEQLYEADYLLSFEAVCRHALQDPLPSVRFLAIRSLQEYDVADLIPYFMQILQGDPDSELRALAAALLGKYVYQGEIEELSHQTLKEIEGCLLEVARGNASPLIRRRVLESLGFSSRREVPRLIEAAFREPEEDWMISALLAMGRSYDSRWATDVLKMLDHLSLKIRLEAVRAAGELEIPDAKPQLLELLEDDDQNVRLAAVWSLSQIGGTGLQQVFESLLQENEDEDEIQAIEDALENLVFNESMGLYKDLDLEDDYDDLDLYGDED